MDIIVGTLLFITGALLWIYFSRSNSDEKLSIPYAKHESYPLVGHIFSFVRNRKAFLIHCQQRYGQCFKIRLFNQRFTCILSPSDWTTIMRNPAFFFPANDVAMNIFDTSFDYFNYPEFHTELHRQLTQHLKTRNGLHPMIFEFVRRIQQQMHVEKETRKKNGTSLEWIPSGLLALSHRMIFQPSTLALFGDIELHDLEKNFCLFDDKLHYFGASIPRWLLLRLLPKEFYARSQLNSSWLKESNLSYQSQLMEARKTLFLENSDWLAERDAGTFQSALFWASLGNTIPAVFWCLLYILHDTKAIETITQELDTHLPSFSLDTDVDESVIEEWTPERLNSCIYLESAVNETLRLAAAPMMVRKCRQETDIILPDGCALKVQPDETLIHFVGVTHTDANLFPEPDKFIFDRFVNKNPDGTPGFMPFGGGKSMCPGRFFAKNEMKICLAMLLRYMEYQFVDDGKIPTQKSQRIGFGVAPPSQDIEILYRYKS